jgi:hypothetical protein
VGPRRRGRRRAGPAFRHAAERTRRAGRPDLLARAALGLGGGPAGFEVGLLDGEQISLLEEARSDLPDGHGQRSGASAVPDGLHAPSDTGEVIDAQARAAYRQRLSELEQAAAEADAAADIERSARIAAERDALVEALTGAYGLGGRVRRSGSAAERARTAVTARIRDSIRRIGDAHPDLGRHLARSVRTGTFCVYEPDQPVRWSL